MKYELGCVKMRMWMMTMIDAIIQSKIVNSGEENFFLQFVKCSKLQIILAISTCSDFMTEPGDGWSLRAMIYSSLYIRPAVADFISTFIEKSMTLQQYQV